MKTFTFIFIFLLLIFKGFTQNLSGIWSGETEKHLFIVTPTSMELELEKLNDTSYSGVLHIKYGKGGYEHIKISPKYDKKTSLLYMREDSVISYKMNPLEEICLGYNILKFTDDSFTQKLYGKWKDKNKVLFKCPTLWTKYKKKSETVMSVLGRITDVQKVFNVDTMECDSVKIELYDNGTIDNDSVSVYLNGNIEIEKVRLSADPQVFYIHLNKNLTVNKLMLVAVNLGEIPPNTALITIKTKKDSYSSLLSSSLGSNGTIEFQIRE